MCYIWYQSGKAGINRRFVCFAFVDILKTDGFSALLTFLVSSRSHSGHCFVLGGGVNKNLLLNPGAVSKYSEQIHCTSFMFFKLVPSPLFSYDCFSECQANCKARLSILTCEGGTRVTFQTSFEIPEQSIQENVLPKILFH